MLTEATSLNKPFEGFAFIPEELYPGYQPLTGIDVFAANLRFLLQAADISQKELANQLGKSEGHVSKICNGMTSPKLDTAIQIADIFNVNITKLLSSQAIDTFIIDRWQYVEQLSHDPELLNKLDSLAKLSFEEVLVEFGQANRRLTQESKPHLLDLLTIEARWKLREVILAVVLVYVLV